MANKNIKGITIEINGNTQPLSNAFKDLTTQSKALDKEISNVNKALKLDPGNAEQVARKLELLEEKADLAEQKVEALKKAQKEMDAQGVSKSSEEYQRLTTEIVKAEGNLSQINKEIRNTNDEFNKVSESTRLLNTYLSATGQSVDSLKNIGGISKLVNEFEAGSLGAQGFNKIINALSQELTGSAKNADLLRTALSSGDFTQVSQAINKLTTDATAYRTELTDLENAQNRLNTYFSATGTSVRDFSNVLGSELTAKLQSGKASSQEMATALDKIGASALQNSGDIDKFKVTLDSVDSGVSFERINNELNSLGSEFKEGESDVEGFKDSLESIAGSSAASAIADVTEQVGELGDKFSEFGEMAMEASGDVQDSTNKIKIGLGETGEEAERSGEIVQNVFKNNYGQSLDDVSEKFVYVKQALGDMVNEGDLEPLLEQFITLDDNGMDFNETVRACKNLMTNFGIDSSKAMDMLTTGMQHGLNYTDELGDNLAEYSGRWAEAGMSVEDYFSILEAGADKGAYNLDKVGDFLNEFLTSLNDGRVEENLTRFGEAGQEAFAKYWDGTATAQDVLNAFIHDLKGMPDVARASLMSDVWSSLGEDNMQGMILALGDVENKYGDVGGAAQQAAEDNSNAFGSMQRKWEELAQAFAPIGEDLAEIANTILDAVIPVVKSVVGFFENMPEPIRKVIEVIGAVVAGITALAPIIGTIINVCGPVVSVIQTISTWLSTLWATITGGGSILSAIGTAISGVVTAIGGVISAIGAPLLGAIAAVVAVVVGLIAYFNNWGGCADWLNEKWAQFTEWFGGVFSGLKDSVVGAWNSITQGITDAWNNIWTTVQNTWQSVVDWFSGIFTGIGDTIGGAWNTVTQGITDTWNSLWSGVQSIWESISGWFSTIFDNLNLGTLWDSVMLGITGPWQAVWTGVQTFWDTISSWFTSIFGNLNLGSLWDSVLIGITGPWNAVWTGVQAFWDTIATWFTTIFDGLNLGGLWDSAISTISSIWESCWNTVESIWNSVSSTLSSGFDSLKSTLTNLWDSFTSNLNDLWNKGWDGIKRIFDSASQALQGAWNTLCNFLSNLWNQTTSNVSNVAQNLQNTLSNIWNAINSTAQNIWNGILSTISNIVSNLQNTISNTFNNIQNTASNVWNTVSNVASNAWNGIVNTVTNCVNNIKNFISNGFSSLGNIVQNALSAIPRMFQNIFNSALDVVRNFVSNVQNALSNIGSAVSGAISSVTGFLGISVQTDTPIMPIPTQWMAKGGILTKPTLFGAGEAGPEAVIPLNRLEDFTNNEETNNKLDTLIDVMKQFCSEISNKEFNVNIDSRRVATAIGAQMDNQLGVLGKRKARQ